MPEQNNCQVVGNKNQPFPADFLLFFFPNTLLLPSTFTPWLPGTFPHDRHWCYTHRCIGYIFFCPLAGEINTTRIIFVGIVLQHAAVCHLPKKDKKEEKELPKNGFCRNYVTWQPIKTLWWMTRTRYFV